MTERARINFHCHSDISDGRFSPETLAALLARDRVRCAALTDHDSIDGLVRFEEAMRQHNVGSVTGVEITSRFRDNEIHILGYGFSRDDASLRQTLLTIRRHRRIGPQMMLASLRDTLKGSPATQVGQDEARIAQHRQLAPFDSSEIIRRIHDAGGLAFLAHPWVLTSDVDELTSIVQELKTQGLDGIEAYYADYTQEQRDQLAALARDESLLTSGGTDIHGPGENGMLRLGVEVPLPAWKAFRGALRQTATSSRAAQTPATERLPVLRWRQLVVRIALPAFLTLAFFLFTCFGVLIPLMEDRLMERKRETARELTAAAASLLEEFSVEEQEGLMTRAEAQASALARVRNMRYGPNRKDYFWIIDTHPTMLMHPYRDDLEGSDLTSFTDARGNHMFVLAAEEVREDGEGYIQYLWQYQDDPTRVAHKLSHVRRFEPWGWIVGTGIYIEDVQREICAVTHRLLWGTLGITVIVTGLLAYIVRESLRLERERSRTEAALRESHEQYRILVDTASEGTLLLIDGKCVFANKAMLDLLGYTPEQLALLEWDDLLPETGPPDPATTRHLADLIEGRPAPLEHSGQLLRRDGQLLSVSLFCQSIPMDDRRGLILTARELRPSDGLELSRQPQQKELLEELQTSLLFLTEPLTRFRRPAAACALTDPIQVVANQMSREGVDAVIIESEEGLPLGIVTDGDLRRRVLARGLASSRPVYEIMSSPILCTEEQTLAHEALLRMREAGVHHLAVRDAEGHIRHLVRDAELVGFDQYAAAVVVREIQQAASLDVMLAARERVPPIIDSLIAVSATPRAVMRLLTAVHDAATVRLVHLAMEELGPPPARFAFLAMGSQGRKEHTLLTDQDNGILYEDVEPARDAAAREYFRCLGDRVCRGLDTVGYRFCEGGAMARSAEWCGPLTHWQQCFARWIATSEPKDLLRIDMCFDFRCVYGAEELTHVLRRFVFQKVDRRSEFLLHFAHNALQYKPPLNFFGKILTTPVGDENVLDLKAATMAIVKFARIYALRHKLAQTGTIDRLERLASNSLLSKSGHDDALVAFNFLASLRLRQQIAAHQAGRPLDNLIDPRHLPHIEAATLRESLGQITVLQKRLAYDFLGTADA